MDACDESFGGRQDVAYNDCIKRRFEPYCIYKTFGRMVELVDTDVPKASAERREGSSPSLTTNVGVADLWYHTTDRAEETSPPEYL